MNIPEGLIARYVTYNKSNSDSDRDILTDLTGNGHDITLYNFGWSGMSGYGGYPISPVTTSVSSEGNELISPYSVKVTKTGYTGMRVCTLKQGESVTFKYKIEGNKADYSLYLYTYLGNTPTIIKPIPEDGSYEDTVTNTNEEVIRVFLACRTTKEFSDMNMTITILPEYPGALVSDGVDDYGIAEPYGTVGTVIVMLDEISWDLGNYLYNADSSETNGRIYCWKSGTSEDNYIYSGRPSTITPIEDKFITFTRDPLSVTNSFYLFGAGSGGSKISVALYALEMYNRSLSTEEIQSVKDRLTSEYNQFTSGI